MAVSAAELKHDADFPILHVGVKPGDSAIFWSDVHAPIHDKLAMGLVVQAHRLIRPRLSVAGGDIFDVMALSSHRKAARQQLENGSLAGEADSLAAELDEIARASDYAVILPGNHEGRVERLVDDVPGLHGVLKWHTPFDSVLGLWDCLPTGAAVRLGPLLLCHGHDLAGSLAASPALSVLRNYPGQSTIFGHCHKIDVATRPSLRNGHQVVHGAWTFGHLSDPRRQGYAAAFRGAWQQGFGHIEFWDRGDGRLGFTCHPIRIYPTVTGGRVCRVAGVTLRAEA